MDDKRHIMGGIGDLRQTYAYHHLFGYTFLIMCLVIVWIWQFLHVCNITQTDITEDTKMKKWTGNHLFMRMIGFVMSIVLAVSPAFADPVYALDEASAGSIPADETDVAAKTVNDVMYAWEDSFDVMNGKAYAKLSVIDAGEAVTEPESDEALVVLYEGGIDELSEDRDDKLTPSEEAVVICENTVSFDGDCFSYEIPAYDLEPGNYTIAAYMQDKPLAEKSLYVVLVQSDTKEGEALYTADSTVFVPKTDSTDEESDEEASEQTEENRTDENGTDENGTDDEEIELTENAETTETLDDRNVSEIASGGVEEEDSTLNDNSDGGMEADEIEVIKSDPDFKDELMDSGDSSTDDIVVSLSGGKLSVLYNDSETHTLDIVLVDRGSEYNTAGTRYFAGSIKDVKNTAKLISFDDSEYGFKMAPGSYRIYAVENLTGGGCLYSSSCVTYFVPTAIDEPEITGSESGSPTGKITVPSKSSGQPTWLNISGQKLEYWAPNATAANYVTCTGNSTTISSLAAGTYKVRYAEATGTDTDNADPAYAAPSSYTAIVVPAEDTYVTSIDIREGSHIISGSTINMYKGQTRVVSAWFNNGESTPSDTSITWSTSDKKVATVDQAGNVKAVNEGSAAITVTSKATGSNAPISKSYNVEVTSKVPAMKFAKSSVVLEKGAEAELTFSVPAKTGIGDYYAQDNYTVYISDDSVFDLSCISWKIKSDMDPDTGKGSIYIPSGKLSPGTATVYLVYTKDGLDKWVSCDITVNGVADVGGADMIAVKGGRKQTGWVYIDSLGKITTKNDAAQTCYIDPVTGKAVGGTGYNVQYIGKDAYLFNGYHLYYPGTDGQITINSSDKLYVCANSDGKLLTGWRGEKGKERYYDPLTCYRVNNAFVPYGKGTAYVEGDAATEGYRLNNSFKTINSSRYYFSEGIVKTGWLYLDSTGDVNVKITTKAKAARWLYADTVTGQVAGNGVFTVGGKDYYCKDGKVQHQDPSDFIDIDGNTGISAGDYYVDPNGVIQKNKAVKDGSGNIYYIGSDGHPVINDLVFNGSEAVSLDYNGQAVTGDYLPTLYICGNNNDGDAQVYARADEKDGELTFYSDSDRSATLKNSWLRNVSAPGTKDQGVNGEKYYYVGGAGKIVKGFQTIAGKRYYFDETTGQLEIGERRTVGTIPNSIYRGHEQIVSIKGKLYVIDNNASGEFFPGSIPYKKAGLYMFSDDPTTKCHIDANGQCAINSWKTIRESGVNKKYYFGSYGMLLYGNSSYYNSLSINGKTYFFNTDGSLVNTEQVVKDDQDLPVFVTGKDGMAKTGWIYLDANGNVVSNASRAAKTYYANDITGEIMGSEYNIIRVKGKYYGIDKDRSMAKGWRYFDDPDYYDAVNFSNLHEGDGRFYFYFDPKSGAATGMHKKVPSPMVADSVNGELAVNANGTVRTTSETKDLYFSGTMSYYPVGALVINSQVVIKNKLYSISGDGTVSVSSQNEGSWVDADRSRYILPSGEVARGRTKINGIWYYFDPATGEKQIEKFRKSGSKWYFYGADGQQSTGGGLTVTNGPDSSVSVKYASDGSISSIVNFSGKKATNDIVIYNSESFLVKNGALQTGIVNHATSGIGLYNDADGKPHDTGSSNAIIRVGRKYYMCNNGKLLCNSKYEIHDFNADGSMPESDVEVLGEYYKFWYDALGSYSPLEAYTGADGQILANRKIASDGAVTGRFGIRIDYTYEKSSKEYNLFMLYKLGGKWYVPNVAGPKQISVTLNELSSGSNVQAVISCGNNGVVKGVYGADGKGLTGWFGATDMTPFSTDMRPVFLKNGTPQTGVQTVTHVGGYKMKYNFDADTGALIDRIVM